MSYVAPYAPESPEESEFLASYDPAKFPVTVVTVDVVLLWAEAKNETAWVLLVKRKNWPYRGWFALPGGFMGGDEKDSDAARRELREETGLALNPALTMMWPLRARSEPERDPRCRAVSLPFVAVQVGGPRPVVAAGDDAEDCCWVKVSDILNGSVQLAFDHWWIVNEAVDEYYDVVVLR